MLISSLAPPGSPWYQYQERKRDREEERCEDWVEMSVVRITETRGKEMYPVSMSHVCSKERCNPMSEMDLIQAGRLPASAQPYHSAVYVCRYHEVHVCTLDTCNAYVGTHDGVCTITNIYHGQTNGERAYVPIEKRTAHLRKNGPKGMSARDANERDQEQQEESEVKRRRVQLAEHSRKNVFGALFKTTAVAKELAAVAVVEEEKAVVVQPVKLVEKVADEQLLLLKGPQAIAPKRPRVSKKKHRQLYDEAEAIITQLLYSGERKTINAEKRAKLDEQRDRVVKAYYADRAKVTFPILTEMLNKAAAFDMRLPHMRVLKRDEKRIAHYVSIVLQSWKIVTESPWGASNPGFKFEAHALSILYKMRKGLVLKGMALLPLDPYLYSLPLRIDLHLFGKGFHSKVITAGMKSVVAAYESAIAAQWPPTRLMLDLDPKT
jgi:hypothetical protein